MSKHVRGKKDVQINVRFSKKFVQYMDFHAEKLNISRTELIEKAIDFVTTNFEQFQTALARFNEAQKKFDSVTTEEELVQAFRELGEAMKI